MLVGLQNSYLVLRREDARIERGFSSRTRLVVFATLRQKTLNWTQEDKQARKCKTDYSGYIVLLATHMKKRCQILKQW